MTGWPPKRPAVSESLTLAASTRENGFSRVGRLRAPSPQTNAVAATAVRAIAAPTAPSLRTVTISATLPWSEDSAEPWLGAPGREKLVLILVTDRPRPPAHFAVA